MDVSSLTQTEAEERAALIGVESYHVDLDLTALPQGPQVRATSTIRFSASTPGTSTFVDCCAEVVSASLNGKAVSPAEQGRIVLADLAGENTLVVATVQSDTETGAGVHRAVDPADGEVYLWTSFEPDEARFVWACFDQPDLKAPHTFTVTAPGSWTVLSNSGDAQVETVDDSDDGARRWTFPATPPLSTYNPVVLAGPLHEIRREAGGHDLGVYARRSLAGVLERDAEELFTVTAQGLAFYAEVFGMPFGQRRYDQAFLPEFGGAMENYGCVAWSDNFLSRTAPTPAERELLAKVLLHEMAHMWFGNIVTMRWWDDLWLNEAFAEFACNWAAVRATSYTDSWAGHLAADQLEAYLADQGPTSHPIRQPIRDVDEAASIFDAITYPKGATVLWQLMAYVGEQTFSEGMTAYFARHAWGNTTLQDLVDELAAASGRDLDAWRTGWLETAGTDRLTLESGPDGFTLVARGPAGGAPRPHLLAVSAYRRAGDALERTARVEVEVEGERTAVDLEPGADLYLVNDDNLTFATVGPDTASRSALFENAALLPTPIARAVALASIWDLLVTAEATAAEVVPALLAVIRAETADTVVEPYLRLATDAAEKWSADADRDGLLAQVAAACRSLAVEPTRRQVALRVVARTGSADDLAWLEAQEEDDVDLAWRALVRKAAVAQVSDDEVRHLLERDPDPDAWVRALTVRAAKPAAEDKEAVWQTLVVDRKVPVGLAGTVARTFWQPGQGEVLRPYTERFLDLLPGLDRGGMIAAMVYTDGLLPSFGVDGDYLDRADVAAQQAAPVVRKTYTELADRLRRMIAARAATSPQAR